MEGRVFQDVAQKLSRLSATDGQEKSHRDGSLLLWKIRLEGLAARLQSFRDDRPFVVVGLQT